MARLSRSIVDLDPRNYPNGVYVTSGPEGFQAVKPFGQPLSPDIEENKILSGLVLGGSEPTRGLLVPFSGIIMSRNPNLAVTKREVLQDMRGNLTFKEAVMDLQGNTNNPVIKLEAFETVPLTDVKVFAAKLAEVAGIALIDEELRATAALGYQNGMIFRFPVRMTQADLQNENGFRLSSIQFFKDMEMYMRDFDFEDEL